MKKFTLVMAATVAVAFLVGCSATTTTPAKISDSLGGKPPSAQYALSSADREAVEVGVRKGLIDPQSATFGTMAGAKDTEVAASDGTLIHVCGTVNGKNTFGGYTGSQLFSGVLMIGSKGRSFVTMEIGSNKVKEATIITMCNHYGVVNL